ERGIIIPIVALRSDLGHFQSGFTRPTLERFEQLLLGGGSIVRQSVSPHFIPARAQVWLLFCQRLRAYDIALEPFDFLRTRAPEARQRRQNDLVGREQDNDCYGSRN